MCYSVSDEISLLSMLTRMNGMQWPRRVGGHRTIITVRDWVIRSFIRSSCFAMCAMHAHRIACATHSFVIHSFIHSFVIRETRLLILFSAPFRTSQTITKRYQVHRDEYQVQYQVQGLSLSTTSTTYYYTTSTTGR